MEQVNQRKAGVILSYVNLIIGCIVPLLYTPIMLRLMGQAEYGLYSLSQSVIGYLTLLNLGMGTVIVRYTARYRAENRVEDIRKLGGMFLAIYGVMATVVCIVGAVLVWQADALFAEGLSSAEVTRLRILMVIMVISTAVSLPISVFSSIISAYERYVFVRGFGIVTTVAIPCMNLMILYLGGASVGMAFVGLGVQVLSGVLYIWYASYKLHIRPTFKDMPLSMLKEILVFTSFVLLSSLVDMLYWATDKVLIGARLGTAAVAVYNVGGVFTSMMQNMSQAISNVFTPKVMMLSVQDDSKQATSDLLKQIGRLQFYIVSFILSGYTVFGQKFIHLWAGEGYESAYYVALLTMVPLAVPLIQSIAYSACVAQNKHRFRAIIYAIIAVINVATTYLVLPAFGIIGAAVCTAVAFLLGNGIIMNIYYARELGFDIGGFWLTISRIAIAPLVVMATAYWVFNMVISDCSWIGLLIGAIVYSIVFWGASWIVCMNPSEKELFQSMLRKVSHIFTNTKRGGC